MCEFIYTLTHHGIVTHYRIIPQNREEQLTHTHIQIKLCVHIYYIHIHISTHTHTHYRINPQNRKAQHAHMHIQNVCVHTSYTHINAHTHTTESAPRILRRSTHTADPFSLSENMSVPRTRCTCSR